MRLALVAGEASGDLLGAGLLRALRARVPKLDAQGIAGPLMQQAGCRSLYPLERLSVMGLVEVLGRYPEVLRMRRQLAARLLDDPPDVFVGIDAPDFNLGLERRLHAAGIPTVHYVSPSVWAWRRYRLRKIARSVDLMLTLFPFEERFYVEHGLPVRFVGHPLADRIPAHSEPALARAELGLQATGELVALLPGSRVSEVRYLAQPMLEAARWLARRRPGVAFVVPAVNARLREVLAETRSRVAPELAIELIDGRSRVAMAAADAVLLASGTATLEALLIGRPMVVTYRTNPLTARVMRALLHVPYVSLPNLLAGRRLVAELLQEDATPERLGAAVLDLLEQPQRQRELAREYSRIRAELSRGADEQAACAVLDLLAGSVR